MQVSYCLESVQERSVVDMHKLEGGYMTRADQGILEGVGGGGVRGP